MQKNIECPKCNFQHDVEDLISEGELPFSIGNESGKKGFFFCLDCDNEIKVREHVIRTWEVIKCQ